MGSTKPCAAGWFDFLKTRVCEVAHLGTTDTDACNGKAEPGAFLKQQPGTCVD